MGSSPIVSTFCHGFAPGRRWNTPRMTDFEGVDLRGAQFRDVDLSGARFEGANLTDVKFAEVWFVNVEIDGMLAGLKINGVDVTSFVTSELARIDPERALMQPTDPEGMRKSWREISARWDETIERARNSSPRRRCTRRSTASSRLCRRCATSCSRPTSGSPRRSSAEGTTRSGCRTRGASTSPGPASTATRIRRSPMRSRCVAIEVRASRSTSRIFSSQTSPSPVRCSRTEMHRSRAACTRSSKRSSGTSVTRRAILDLLVRS